jgi:phosphatidate cytidylyltransferase
MSQLRQRVLTAVPLLAGLLLLLFAAPVGVVIAASTVLIALGAWEWSAFAGWSAPLARSLYVAGVVLAMAAVSWLVPEVLGLAVVLWTAVLWWLLAFIWILRYPTPVPALVAATAGLLVLVPAWLAMITILSVPRSGPQLLMLVLCIVFAADIGAYFAGRRFGRAKLAPHVSPGKTWEGLIGGLLLAGLAAAIGSRMLGLPVTFMALAGLGIAAISVVGDLTESMFKRSVGLKDSGHLIPGHGGVLDRLDSVAPALPTYALALSWLGILS